MDDSIISEKMNGKNLSVIVPTYNGIEKLSSLLQSLEDQIVHGFEVIIFVDGSTDGSKEYLERYNAVNFELRVFFQQNAGRSKVRNAGVEKSKGDLLLFIDDDIQLDQTAIERHIKHHTNSPKSVLVGNVSLADNTFFKNDFYRYRQTIERLWYIKVPEYPAPMDPSNVFVTAANLSMPKALFKSVGGFDENLTDCEDEELGVRLLELDTSIFFDIRIVGKHLDEKTCKDYINRKKEYNRARIQLDDMLGKSTRKSKEGSKFKEIFKAVIYKLLSFQIWVKLIDQELLLWVPKRIRYPLYSAIIYAVVKYDSNHGG